MNIIGQMVQYEQGELSFEETVELFQALLESGLIYNLQGIYQRTAQSLIEEGYILEIDAE
jgi:hypothetical protein